MNATIWLDTDDCQRFVTRDVASFVPNARWRNANVLGSWSALRVARRSCSLRPRYSDNDTLGSASGRCPSTAAPRGCSLGPTTPAVSRPSVVAFERSGPSGPRRLSVDISNSRHLKRPTASCGGRYGRRDAVTIGWAGPASAEVEPVFETGDRRGASARLRRGVKRLAAEDGVTSYAGLAQQSAAACLRR